QGQASPKAISTALDDPELVAAPGEAPYLPPAAPPKPAVTTTVVFDAKTLVDATRRNKVENPTYGQMPTGTPEGRAAVEAAKARMRQRRRRNKMIGWVMAVVVLVLAAGAGFALYRLFEDDQQE